MQPEPLSPQQVTSDLCLHRGHSNAQRQVWLSLCGVSGSWCTHGFVLALWESLLGMGFYSKCDFAPPTILLGILLCPWMWGTFFWWDTMFSCWWLFSSELQFWSSLRRRWLHILLFWHLVRSGALNTMVPAQVLLKEVTITIITPTIVLPQAKQQGGNTTLLIIRKLD